MKRRLTPKLTLLTGLLSALVACDGHSDAASTPGQSTAADAKNYILGSVVIDGDGNRTTYVQAIHSLEAGHYNNHNAIELPGNAVLMAGAADFYVGEAESPVWTRYTIAGDNTIHQTGRLGLLDTGAKGIDFGNAYVDETTAVSVFTNPALAVIWNPKSMTIRGEVDLQDLVRDGYELEVWTTIAHDGLIYIPGRWADWTGSRIFPSVSMTVLDPKAMKVLGTAQDDRCASGGRVVFGKDGYAYVMGDGRNYAIQMFANASGETAPENCLLRIPAGQTEFDKDYYYAVPALTGGLESITELETAQQGTGIGFAKMFYPDQLPDDVKPVDFDFWDLPAHKMWRIELADPPVAEEVAGAPFSAVGFGGSELAGHLYTGESSDGNDSTIYEIDPGANTATERFQMDGYFDGLFELSAKVDR